MKTTDNYQDILRANSVLIDVRAPVEYERGSLPNSINLPLMNNEERHDVGLCYKQKGSEAAITLGHHLVNGTLKEERIKDWISCLQKFPGAYIYCARGGLRSEIVQRWLYENKGLKVKRIKGGYKMFRRYLLEQMEPSQLTSQPIILGGRTGAGKTILLKQLENSIDLEKLAHHRGSSFGGHLDPQPNQANFENALAHALVVHKGASYSTMILESEGTNVGRCFLPTDLVNYFNTCPYVLLEVSLAERVETTYTEYVLRAQGACLVKFGADQGLDKWLEIIHSGVKGISNRLGSQRGNEIRALQVKAHQKQLQSGSAGEHKVWIERLLSDYYDPMYDYQVKKKGRFIIFRGDTKAVHNFLKTYIP